MRDDASKVRLAGSPYRPNFGSSKPAIPFGTEFANKKKKKESATSKLEKEINKEDVKRKETVINNNIDGAIVESIPGNALTAEDTDPETKCKATCGRNEICQISSDKILCKCRPGFGRKSEKTSCASK